METLFYLGIIFVLGALTEWLSPKLHTPRVVGYLMLGLIIGPEVLALIPNEFVDNTHIITDLALSIIAVLVGATLKVSNLKGHGREVVYITVFQSLGAFIVVVVGFILMGNILNFPSQQILFIALLLGGIAAATAPATALALVYELRAKGNFTSTLLAVIAIDDAISLIVFTLALTAGVTLIESGVFEWTNLAQALSLILFSTILGIIAGLLNTIMEKIFTHHKGMETISTLGLIFIVYSLSEYLKLEPLLSSMVMGVVITNMSPDFDLVEEEIDNHLVEIIFMLFFIISAMHLKISAIFTLPIAIVLYVVLRVFGKIIGCYIGAIVSGSNRIVKKYMGMALLPQAGVAIGLALSIQKHEGLQSVAPIILNIVIATTLIHEIIGPFMTKYALQKSGDIEKKKNLIFNNV
ncbi:cation:proton antiporter [Candidatus Sulfurimonas marisnigri]|uniref:Cation:proton antiporter n=1 Tax=Candidatus Sulfurimonas marisnigri TaxID=2740405 RepID=A0A7S7M195_9BACT|nr:cation:proton antiporter [Candidatus Sulfurimonas marisnigri]QOY54394.1 cation:proton antiporter [Candidatus Sulfurimonas marisnigri]